MPWLVKTQPQDVVAGVIADRENGFSERAITMRHGVSLRQVRNILASLGLRKRGPASALPWSQLELEILVRCRMGDVQKRVPYWKLAERMGRTAGDVRDKAVELGLNSATATDIYAATRVEPPKARACLGPRCRGRRKFLSRHKGERLCPGCRVAVGYMSGCMDDAHSAQVGRRHRAESAGARS